MDLNALFEIESLTGLEVLKHDRAILEKREEGRREYSTIVLLENNMVVIVFESSTSSMCFYVLTVADILKVKSELTPKKNFMRLKVKYDLDWDALIPLSFYKYLKEMKSEKKADNKDN